VLKIKDASLLNREVYQFLTKTVIEVRKGNIKVSNVTSSSVNTYNYRSDKINFSDYYCGNESSELAIAIVLILN
jgi:hypothetical protein